MKLSSNMGLVQKKDAFLDRLIPFRGKRPILLEYRSSKVFIVFAMCWAVFTVSALADPAWLLLT
jgi:hypothetical protein